MTWAWQLTHGKDEPLPGVKPYENEAALISDVKSAVESGKAKAGRLPSVLVIGALGRCGRGAVDLCTKAGLKEILVSYLKNHFNICGFHADAFQRNGISLKPQPSRVHTRRSSSQTSSSTASTSQPRSRPSSSPNRSRPLRAS